MRTPTTDGGVIDIRLQESCDTKTSRNSTIGYNIHVVLVLLLPLSLEPPSLSSLAPSEVLLLSQHPYVKRAIEKVVRLCFLPLTCLRKLNPAMFPSFPFLVHCFL